MKLKLQNIWKNDLLRGSSILFAGTMVVNFMAFINHLVMARLLGPVEYGILAAVLGLTYLSNIPVLALDTFTTKIVSSFEARDSYSHTHGLVRYLLMSTVKLFTIIFFILLFVAPHIASYLHLTSVISVYLVWLFVFSSCLVVVTRSVFKGLLKFAPPAINLCLDMMIRVLLSTIFILFLFPSHQVALLGFILATLSGLFISLVQLKFVFQIPATKFNHHHLAFKSVGSSSLLISACYSVMFSVDIILVKHFLSASDAGIYGVLATAGKVIFFAVTPMGAALLPTVSRLTNSLVIKKHLLTILLCTSAVGLSVVLMYFIFPKLIVDFIFTSKFSDAAKYLPWMGLTIFFYSLSSVLSSFLLGINQFSAAYLPLIAALAELIGLQLFHTNLFQVIIVLLSIFAILATSLFVYSLYGPQKKKISSAKISFRGSSGV